MEELYDHPIAIYSGDAAEPGAFVVCLSLCVCVGLYACRIRAFRQEPSRTLAVLVLVLVLLVLRS